jgi:hypothetical protein
MNPSRDLVPLYAADVSTFCKNLRRHLVDSGHDVPGHLALLNMLAKSAGHRNFQVMKALPSVLAVPESKPKPAEALTLAIPRDLKCSASMKKLLACFDSEGRLARFPHKYAAQQIAIWAIWCRLPLRRELTESEVNRYIDLAHTYGDPVTLRRELVNAKLLWRTVDGRVYKKLAAKPDDETKAFLELLFSLTRSA